MKKTTIFLNIFGYVSMLCINAAASIFTINGVTTGEVSDKYTNLFSPAGFTFSIWGAIYLSLFVFVIFQITKGADKERNAIGILFFFSSLLNSTWIFAWHYEQIAISLVIMTLLLLTLMAIYIKLNKDKYGSSLIFVRLPFKLYFAWICVAIIANFAVFLKKIEWDMFGISEYLWTIIVLAVILVLTTFMTLKRKDLVFSLVITWSITGILLRHLNEYNKEYTYIIILIVFMYLVIAVENIYNLYKSMTK